MDLGSVQQSDPEGHMETTDGTNQSSFLSKYNRPLVAHFCSSPCFIIEASVEKVPRKYIYLNYSNDNVCFYIIAINKDKTIS